MKKKELIFEMNSSNFFLNLITYVVIDTDSYNEQKTNALNENWLTNYYVD